jgi:hypothetical protein
MARRRMRKMTPVTQADIDTAQTADWSLYAVSAYTIGQFLFLKLAFHRGSIETICLDSIRADYLFRILREVLPNRGENDGSPLSWAKDSIALTYGHLPVDAVE